MNVENLAADADEFTSNVFLVDDTALIDTGADEIVLDRLEEKDAEIETVVITHSHWDHIENLEEIVARYDPQVYAYSPSNLPDGVVGNTQVLADGETVALGAMETIFVAVHTPGHRDDHICLYSPDEKVLFAGDLIFPGGAFGRTDLEEGDRDTLIESIERITDLDVHELYAGHGEPATDNVNAQIQGSLKEARKHEPKYAEG